MNVMAQAEPVIAPQIGPVIAEQGVDAEHDVRRVMAWAFAQKMEAERR